MMTHSAIKGQYVPSLIHQYLHGGRHRARRNSHPARLAAVSVAAAALGIVGAQDASAAPSNALGPIAFCESGNNPTAVNPSSTASGLYQFLDTSWAAYGGTKYATRAKNATPAQQTEIANAAVAQSGLAPWAASQGCWAGKTGPAPVVAARATAPRVAAPRRHQVQLLPSRAHPVVTKVIPRVVNPLSVSAALGPQYTVRLGDTLCSIAAAHHVPGGWQTLAAMNSSVVANPDLIYVNQHLKI